MMLKVFVAMGVLELLIAFINVVLSSHLSYKRLENDGNFAINSLGLLFAFYLCFYNASIIYNSWLIKYHVFGNIIQHIGLCATLSILIIRVFAFLANLVMLIGALNKTKNIFKLKNKLQEENKEIFE